MSRRVKRTLARALDPAHAADALAVLGRITAPAETMPPADAVAYQLRWLDITRVVAYVAPERLAALEAYASDEAAVGATWPARGMGCPVCGPWRPLRATAEVA
jgi:hypothetical protein